MKLADSVFSKEYTLRGSDFDCFKQIKPSAVMDLFQEVAGQHAYKLGIGFSDMASNGLLWVVLKVKYCVVKAPELYQSVVVSTWPLQQKRLDFQREYLIKDDKGEVLIKGTSQWAVIDKNTRKLTKAENVYKNINGYCETVNFTEKLVRIGDFDGEKATVVKSEFSHTDPNMHVNNAKYGDYVLDAIHNGNPLNIKEFQIDFHKEILVNTKTEIFSQATENTILVKGVQGEDYMFLAKIEREG